MNVEVSLLMEPNYKYVVVQVAAPDGRILAEQRLARGGRSIKGLKEDGWKLGEELVIACERKYREEQEMARQGDMFGEAKD